VSGACDAAAAWTLLAELGRIPSSWVGAPNRRFLYEPGPRPIRDPAFAPSEAHPHSVEGCALYASDVDGILAAEQAAYVMAERLQPWGAPACDRVVWWNIGRERYLQATTDTRPGVCYALLFAWSALQESAAASDDATPGTLFGHASSWADAWRRRASAGGVVPPDGPHAALELGGRPFPGLPNPFGPLAAIEANGYAGARMVGSDGQLPGSDRSGGAAVDPPIELRPSCHPEGQTECNAEPGLSCYWTDADGGCKPAAAACGARSYDNCLLGSGCGWEKAVRARRGPAIKTRRPGNVAPTSGVCGGMSASPRLLVLPKPYFHGVRSGMRRLHSEPCSRGDDACRTAGYAS
jgi:hypothetical protein